MTITVSTEITLYISLHSTAAYSFCGLPLLLCFLELASSVQQMGGQGKDKLYSSSSITPPISSSQSSNRAVNMWSHVDLLWPWVRESALWGQAALHLNKDGQKIGSDNPSPTLCYHLSCMADILGNKSQSPHKNRVVRKWKADERRGGERDLHAHKILQKSCLKKKKKKV